MPTTVYNATNVEQGQRFDRVVVCLDQNDDPFDLTDYTPSGQVRQHHASSFVAATFGLTLNEDPTDGKINLELTGAQTAAMRPGKYVYDIFITGSSGDPIPVLKGVIVINPTATR